MDGDEDGMKRRNPRGPDRGRTGPGRPGAPPDGEGPADDAGFGLVEALIAFVILAVGLLAVAGIALSVAAQTRGAASTTAQSLAGQQVLEVTATSDFGAVAVGTKDTSVTVGNRTFTVTRTVDQPSARTKKITVQVPGSGDQSDEAMITYMHQSLGAPSAP
jgi:Tfp pilus assembly protein PilV